MTILKQIDADFADAGSSVQVEEGQIVGEYIADVIVNKKVIIEVKAVSHLDPAHEAHLVNYLRVTGIEIGLLISFGRSVEVRRRVFTPRPSANGHCQQ